MMTTFAEAVGVGLIILFSISYGRDHSWIPVVCFWGLMLAMTIND